MFLGIYDALSRSVAAGAFYFLLDQKVTKNQVSRKASLPHLAFALQIRQNLGCKTLPYFVRAGPPLQQILLCPCSRTVQHRFA